MAPMSGSVANDEWHLREKKKKKTTFFFLLRFSQIKKKTFKKKKKKKKKTNKQTNPPILRVNLIQNKSLGISERERESKRVLANLVVVVVVLNWVSVALFCKLFDFSRDKKKLYFSLSL